MSGVEIAGLVLGVAGLVPLFKEGYRLVQARRQRRRIRLLDFMNQDTTRLENETQNGETMITSRYQGFYKAYGDAFARGDGIARDSLKDLIIQLQHGLILELLKTPAGAKINGLSQAVKLTINCRASALTGLSELAQRLAVSMPVQSLPFTGQSLPEIFNLRRASRPMAISDPQPQAHDLYMTTPTDPSEFKPFPSLRGPESSAIPNQIPDFQSQAPHPDRLNSSDLLDIRGPPRPMATRANY